jgi:DNA-binding transcriptional regulator YiaG
LFLFFFIFCSFVFFRLIIARSRVQVSPEPPPTALILIIKPVEPLQPAEIRALRMRKQMSQPVFAHYLNVRKDAVRKWERGEKRPDGPSLKLLNLVKAKGLKAIA